MHTYEIDLETLNPANLIRLDMRFGRSQPELTKACKEHMPAAIARFGPLTKELADGPSNLPNDFWGPLGRPTPEQRARASQEQADALRSAIPSLEAKLEVARKGLARLVGQGY